MNVQRIARQAHQLFKLEGWTYGANEPPTQAELENTINYLLENIGRDGCTETETGRFLITERDEGDGDVEVKVCLVLGSSYDDWWDRDG